ncbi:metA [Acrasis kona]|uniref:MetA n=1 Tax=Acrasis kona TaxID=1008807 RepID=A0AAW2YRG5_9EUKA
MKNFVHVIKNADRRAISLVHMSDIHIWQPQYFTNPITLGSILTNNKWRDMKQAQGYLNVAFNRGPNSYHPDLFTKGLKDIIKHDFDHLLITGDITNISLNDEFQRVRDLLNENYLDAIPNNDKSEVWRYCTAIPGNHDAYTPTSVDLDLFGKYFGDTLGYYKHSETCSLHGRFPAIKIIQTQCKTTNVIVLSLCTGVPTKPFVAAGTFGGTQLKDASDILDQAQQHLHTQGVATMYKIILMHHPPIVRHKESWSESLHGMSQHDKKLIDDFCSDHDVDLDFEWVTPINLIGAILLPIKKP